MANIHERAWGGTLSEADLTNVGQGINEVDPDRELTPLAAAVWNGHVSVAQLLLRHNADVNQPSGTRSPLWIAASRTERNAGRIIQILLRNGADPTTPSENDYNSTPLLNAVAESRDVEVISMLVDAGASPTATDADKQSAQILAEKRKDRAVLNALLPRSQRNTNRAEAVYLMVSLLLFIVAWANRNVMVTIGGTIGGTVVAAAAIQRRYAMSGVFGPMIPEVRCLLISRILS
jgi:ankyrin repeat protein